MRRGDGADDGETEPVAVLVDRFGADQAVGTVGRGVQLQLKE